MHTETYLYEIEHDDNMETQTTVKCTCGCDWQYKFGQNQPESPNEYY